jgi:hypothetical protein
MRDPERIEPILQTIREIWYMCPDLRLPQLIMNALSIAADPYHVEDDHLFQKLKEYKKELEGKH